MSGDAPNKRIRVFISSTYTDLKDCREKCIEGLLKLRDTLGVESVHMEIFGAYAYPPKDECLEKVRNSNVFVGILGMRYGQEDRDSGKSLTHLEYEEAQERGLPCLMYLIDKKSGWVHPADVDLGDAAKNLEQFKERLCSYHGGHGVGWFNDPTGLAVQLAADITNVAVELSNPGHLGTRIDRAINRGIRYIRDVEDHEHGGWSNCVGVGGSCWDTACSILALMSKDAQSSEIQLRRGQQWLMWHRNQSGGWRGGFESDSNACSVVDTAAALTALAASDYQDRGAIDSIAALLLRGEISFGGWPDTIGRRDPVTCATGWAVRALRQAGYTDSTSWPERALEWLTRTQNHDGGWGPYESSGSSIGKTKDALMALSLFDRGSTDRAMEKARGWLLKTRRDFPSPGEFGKGAPAEPLGLGLDQTVENVIYFLESCVYADVPVEEPPVKDDLEWLMGKLWYYFAPLAIQCLAKYRGRTT